ncbi:hypothetical protein GINT2_000126 [Glugoides intestinalis]
MNIEQPRNKLILPLAATLLNYIKREYPDIGPIIISTVEYTVKESKNHYIDVMRALEPLLKENTKNFVDKLFMFRKKMCRDGTNCSKPVCLFAHNDDELIGVKRTSGVQEISNTNKRYKIDNNEVIFNKVDESKYTMDELKLYAVKYGNLISIRRLNKGKYLLIFEDTESARKLVEDTEYILDDAEIKKFFNINVPLDQNKKVDLNQLFQDQKELIDRICESFDAEQFSELKMVTFKIRHHVMSLMPDKRQFENGSSIQKSDENEDEVDIASSLYYNMFAE